MSFFFTRTSRVLQATLVALAAVCTSFATHSELLLAEELLTVGSPAPKLDIEHWVSDRNGEMPQVTKFESGKVYVIEFWATWCRPCIMTMPHLAETQEKYATKGVQLISVSDEDLDTVDKFLSREVHGVENQTYRDLTSAYCLTSDPDESVSRDYMLSAGLNGIPSAFIVGKSGLIEWYGHPMEMDEPLARVVEGKWSREKFARKLKKEKELKTLAQELWDLKEDGEANEALAKLDTFMADLDKEGQLFAQCSIIRLDILIEAGGPEAVREFRKVTSGSVDPQVIDQLAWGIVEKAKAGKDIQKEMLQAACIAAQRAVELSKENGSGEQTAVVLDTHANLLLLCDKLDEAIKVQKEATELSDDKQIKKFYDILLKTKMKTDD